MESRAKVEHGSGKHSTCTHFRKEPNGDICLKTKITRFLAEDLLVQSCPERKTLVISQLWITKSSVKEVNHEVNIDMPWWYRIWQRSGHNPTHVKQILVRKHERAYRQSGLGNEWWADSMECCCFRNIQDILSDGKTPFEKLFGIPFHGTVIPFGAMDESHFISAKDLSRLHQFGPKVLPGLFLRYALHAGGILKGDILIADIEELEQMDASELHARRLNAKEVLTPMR